jgi:hypothetical protein
VLKRIGALEGGEGLEEVKEQAGRILARWGGYLEEISAMAKKEEGQNGEKKGHDEEMKEGQHEGTKETGGEHAEEKTKETEPESMDHVETARPTHLEDEDFVMVEGTGESDPLAQRSATATPSTKNVVPSAAAPDSVPVVADHSETKGIDFEGRAGVDNE